MADDKKDDKNELTETQERHAVAGDAKPDPYAPASKEQLEFARKQLKESEATSVVLGCHVGDPLVVAGEAVLLGTQGAGSGYGFYAAMKGNAAASKVAVKPEEAGDKSK